MAVHLFMVLVLLAAASASPIKEIVNDCAAITNAFSLLQGQFENATRGSTLSMTLTLNCSADWSGCGTTGNFAPAGPANSTKQPKVVVALKTDCKKGQTVTIIKSGPHLFNFNTQASNATMAVSVTGPLTIAGALLATTVTADTGSTVAVKDVSITNASLAIQVDGLDKLSVTGGQFSYGGAFIYASGITKSVSVSKSTFEGSAIAAIGLEALPGDTKVSITGNTFKNAASNGRALSVSQLEGRMNIDLRKNTVDNTSSNPICIDSPLNITDAKINVAGSVGFAPTKADRTLTPAGWPTSEECTIAEFSAV